MLNEHFDLSRTVVQMKGYCTRNGLKTGRTGCFPKGCVPPNKGRKGWSAPGTEATRFKKGSVPHTVLPVGTYTTTTARRKFNKRNNRYYDIPSYWRLKVADRQWVFVHRMEWESEHGPIEKGHAVIFVDGDSLNPSLDNLDCIDRGTLGILNRHSEWATSSGEIRRTILAKAKLQRAVGISEQRSRTGPKGERKSLQELADDYGLNLQTVQARMKRFGFSLNQALTTPLHRGSSKRRAAFKEQGL